MSMYDYLKTIYESGIIQELGFLDGIYQLNSQKELLFDELINDDNWCLEIIRTNLDFKSKNFQINKAYAYRFKHIVICWLLGIGCIEFVNPNMKYNMLFQKTWQLSAFTHDYGWFCEETFDNPREDFLNSFGDYYLLKDDYKLPILSCLHNYIIENSNLIPFSYETIKNYYFKSIEYHRKEKERGNMDDKETCDHGIVGGCLAFKEYTEYLENRKQIEDGRSIVEMNKTACLITASHNIWGEQIRKENGLLSIMALVDTIECTKLFSSYDKVNRLYPLIKWQTLYTRIKLEINKDSLMIDLNDLSKYIESKKGDKFGIIKRKFDKYWNSLKTIDSWTPFSVISDENEGKSIIFYSRK